MGQIKAKPLIYNFARCHKLQPKSSLYVNSQKTNYIYILGAVLGASNLELIADIGSETGGWW